MNLQGREMKTPIATVDAIPGWHAVLNKELVGVFPPEAGDARDVLKKTKDLLVASAEELGDLKTFKIHAHEPVPDQEWEG